jgi:LPXTG-site transpeptidase (sortase) family protein
MRTFWAVVGTLLVVVSLAGLVLLAAGPPGDHVEQRPAVDAVGATAQPKGVTGTTPIPVAKPTGSTGLGIVTAAPAAGQTAPATPAPSFHVMFDDRLVDNRMGWADDPQSTAWFSGSMYRLFARQPNRFVAIAAPLAESLGDVIMTAAFHKLGGPPGGAFGLIVRDQGGNDLDGRNQGGQYYVLEVGDNAEVGIWRRERDHWIELLPWTPAEAVRRGGAPNEMEVWAIGDRLTLLVNGVQVASRTDTALSVGSVGAFVGGDFNEVALDRLIVRAPAQADSPTHPTQPEGTATDENGPGSRLAPPTVAAVVATPTPRPFLPITRVSIPSISLDATAVPAELVQRQGGLTWEVPPFTIGHAQATAGAGDPGNAVLVGHVTSRSVGNVFEHLDKIGVGDAVQVFSAAQIFEYHVVEVRTVARTNVSVVRPTSTPSITLITCTGLWLPVVSDYAERLVVRAELVPPATSPAAASPTDEIVAGL